VFDLFVHQDQFLYSTKRHTGLVGGYRSGKSFVGTLKTLSKKIQYPGIDVAYYLPTNDLIKTIAFKRFNELLEIQNIPYSLNQTDKTYYTAFGNIFLRSMDKPEHIVGYEVGYSVIDEVDVVHKNKIGTAFKNILARNSARLPDGTDPQLDFVSTPEGFGFLYNFFITGESENKLLIKAKTTDNKEITQGYIDSLKDEFSAKQLEAYLNGEFTNLASGTVYGDYDRDANHTDRIIEETDKVLFVGMDFNSTQMAAIFHIVEDGLPMALDEITKGYNTEEVCKLIKARYPNKKIIIYPDASGDSNKSSSSRTDHDIIKQHGFQLYTHKTNPLVKDRVNTMNMMFRKGYKINRHKCPSYAQAMEQQVFDANGVPDKKSGFDHCSDAGGYYIFTYSKPRNRVFL
jgi:hypothetical protein